MLRLYRERYAGFNVRHFHQIARREHGVTVSYSFVKQTLQTAGLVKKQRPRGRHRRRREPRACFGELLHLDGSVHAWFALVPEERPCLIAVSDDATKRVLHAALYPSESTPGGHDGAARRASGRRACRWRCTRTARTGRFTRRRRRGRSTNTQLTQVGRALARLGIEHIPAYSPQARGRSERLNRTFQDRLVNELRVARDHHARRRPIAISPSASCPQHNATFARAPRDPASAFVPLGDGRSRRDPLPRRGTRRRAATTPSRSGARCCRSRRSRAGALVPACEVTVRQHLDGALHDQPGRAALATFATRTAGPWTLPRRGRPRHGAHRRLERRTERGGPQRPQASL